MSSKKQRKASETKNSTSRSNSNYETTNGNATMYGALNDIDVTSPPLLTTQESTESSDLSHLSESLGNSLKQKIKDVDAALLLEIQNKYEINPVMAEYLLNLRDFEIVVVVDDSGSMNTKVGHSEKTRWSELCQFVKILIDIVMKFTSRGIDIHLIKGETYTKVKDPKFVDQLFNRTPRGCTPLVRTLEKVFTSELARRGRDKKLLVFVATDGEPTNEDGDPIIDEFKELLRNTRNPETTHLSFLLCTDDPDCVGYLKKLDRKMQNLDVTRDYEDQKKEVRRCRKDKHYPFSRGDHIVKALVGGFIPNIDRLDESDEDNN